jgi:hypothetical protein
VSRAADFVSDGCLSLFQAVFLQPLGQLAIANVSPRQFSLQEPLGPFLPRGGMAEEAEWLTIPKAIEQTEDMLKTADAGSRSFLLEYRAYLNERLEHAFRAVS